MARRRLSLRGRVLFAMLVPALLLLVGLFALFNLFETHRARNDSVEQATNLAAAIAGTAAARTPHPNFAAFDALVGDSQLTVIDGGSIVYRNAADTEPRHFSVTHAFPGGRVVVTGDVENETGLALQLTGISGAILVILVVVGILGASTLSRGIRRPIEEAVVVADRLAGGDLGARIEPTEPGPFNRLARSFNGMADRLQTADRDQERFLGDVAHEIATPVNAVIGLAGTALDQKLDTPADRAEASRLLDSEATRLRGLLDDLRGLRLLERPGSVASEDVDLGAVARQLAARFGPDARSAGLTVALDVAVGTDAVTATTDARCVERALGNFVTNAIRYTPRGGTVAIRVTARPDAVVIAVADNGIGIAPGEQDRVFDRFYRVGEARDRITGGTGLGLAIARRAASAVGATIELDSAPQQGSEFRLVVPRQRHAGPAPAG